MTTVKELWDDLFDNSLEIYKNEDETTRNISMILHILKLEYLKTSHNIIEIKRNNENQSKEISEYKQNICRCKDKNRTPLKTLTGNSNVFETTPKKKVNENITAYYDVPSDNEDIFNHQISEVDVNISKENDNSLFVDDSVEDFEITTSPKLNKQRNKRKSRASKFNNIKNTTFKDLVVMGTPTSKMNKSKKFKQTKITLRPTTKEKNCTNTKNESALPNNSIDTDETLFLPAQQKNIANKKYQSPSEEFFEILDEFQRINSNKKNRLENSFDCLPGREDDSPDFAYKREAVRKKADRMKLQGWDCPDCEKFYGKLSDEEMKKRMDHCSRHRNKFNPNILTPRGFWNPDFSPTQDSIAFKIE